VLSDVELAAIWQAAGDDNFGRIVKLLMLLAQRRTEVGGICWSELDLKHGTWTIPSRRSKNGRAHMLPLPPLALEIIAGVPRMVGRDTLFGARVDSGLTGWARPKAALDARLGSQVESWRLHVLVDGTGDVAQRQHHVVMGVGGHLDKAAVTVRVDETDLHRHVRAIAAILSSAQTRSSRSGRRAVEGVGRLQT
jgi:integrase